MDSVSFFPSFLKMLAALTIVLGLMIGAMFVLKRFMNQAVPGMDDGQAIRILSTRYLGPKNSIMLVEVLGQLMVIGLSNQQMSLLATITDVRSAERMQSLQNPVKKTPAVMEQLARYKDALRAMAGLRGGTWEK
ncbi:MAG: flagellar biosynthetic protein FliO [Deltaproteobacteria bacterium]|nr:flagellar biosynthetic protein FliO [Deltaproteobacteria bacterium]